MSRKIKLHSLHFLFHIFSFLADKSGGWKLFVKPKLIIGSLLISVSAYAQNAPQNNQIQQNTTPVFEERITCYDVVEQMPFYPGGEAELSKFISENIKYPYSAIKHKIQGRVIVRFIVTKQGTIDKIEVLRSLSPDCDKEAVRVISYMPKWIPGKQNGVKVSAWFTLPIQFKLDTHQKTTKIYDVVDQMPQFPGGDMQLFKFIAENLKDDSPVAQCYNPIVGRVICRFVVKKDGSIDQIEVVRSLDPTLDKEAVRVIRCMPKWIPGKHKGKKVNVYFTLPISFKPF